MSRAELKKNKNNKNKVKRVTIICLVAVLATVGIVTGGSYLYLNSKLNKLTPVQDNRTNESEVFTFTEQELSCVDVDGFVNILLLGIDSRDMNNLEGWRADAIIIASIKEATGEVYLTSVYRDTFLLMGEEGFYDKVTHSFYYGGMKDTIKTLNQAMDLNIKNYVVFNFKAVADVVDAMGGLDINIEEYEISELNRTNIETCRIIGQTDVKEVTAPGLQNIDGAQAVSYGRIRYGVGDDFKRTERMRTVITKVLEKAKTMSLSDINELIDLGLAQIKTNLNSGDIIGLGMRAPKYKIMGSVGFPYNVATGTLDGVSYVFPTGLYDDVAKLHVDTFGQTDYTPSDMILAISNEAYAYCLKTENQNEVDIEQYSSDPAAQQAIVEGESEIPAEEKPTSEITSEPIDELPSDNQEAQSPEEGDVSSGEVSEGKKPDETKEETGGEGDTEGQEGAMNEPEENDTGSDSQEKSPEENTQGDGDPTESGDEDESLDEGSQEAQPEEPQSNEEAQVNEEPQVNEGAQGSESQAEGQDSQVPEEPEDSQGAESQTKDASQEGEASSEG